MICAAVVMLVAMGHPGTGVTRCSKDATVRAFVGGHELVVADLTHHQHVITFYGRQSVVRIDQHGKRIKVRAVTVHRARLRIKVTFT